MITSRTQYQCNHCEKWFSHSPLFLYSPLYAQGTKPFAAMCSKKCKAEFYGEIYPKANNTHKLHKEHIC